MSVPAQTSAFFFKTNEAAKCPNTGSGPLTDIIGSRTSSTSSKLYHDGVVLATATTADTGSLTTSPVCYGARGTGASTADNFMGMTEQVAGFGSSFSATDVSNFRARVATLKAALGR